MPTQRRRHAITETPAVAAVLDQLRGELGGDRIEFGELVILGATAKLAMIRAKRDEGAQLRHRLADRIRTRDLPVDLNAAEEVRRSWAR